jgi:PAS domain S-box-containing protein
MNSDIEPSEERASLHSVQFYENDGFLVELLEEFVCNNLRAGHAVVMVATTLHVAMLHARLQRAGVDFRAAAEDDRFIVLDANDTLARIMGDAPMPAAGVFAEVVEPIIRRAAAQGRPLCIFGEMVALLCRDGRHDAAMRLEQHWNQLRERHRFSLLCAYPLDCFPANDSAFAGACEAHDHVHPSEHYARLPEPERARFVALLEDRARMLESEVSLRRTLQKKLAQREHELFDFLENGVEPLHKIGADGTILWANRAALALLGYEAGEYVGRNIAQFHADPKVAREFIGSLLEDENVRDTPAQMLTRDNRIRHVLISSNAFRTDGKFVYARCFSRDVTRRVHAEQQLHDEIKTRAMLEQIVSGAADYAIVRLDRGGRVQTWNDGAQRMAGYAASEIIGQDFALLHAPNERSARIPEQALANAREHGKYECEGWRMRKDGSQFRAHVQIDPLRDPQDDVIAFAMITRDVS